MTDQKPIYVLAPTTVREYADAQKQRYLDLGCSEEFAEARRRAVLDRGVQVKSAFDANAEQRKAAGL